MYIFVCDIFTFLFEASRVFGLNGFRVWEPRGGAPKKRETHGVEKHANLTRFFFERTNI